VKSVDLFLGSVIGLWVLQQIVPDDVNQVFTLDQDILEFANRAGIRSSTEHPAEAAFESAGVGFSIHYPTVFKPEFIAKYQTIYNLHPGYLPWGRGFYPVFWALWEETPAGATLHEISERVDEGPIVDQIKVEHTSRDTGGGLYDRVRKAEEKLFGDYWRRIVRGENLATRKQDTANGSFHLKREFFALKQSARSASMTGTELIKLIRCLTFPGYSGLEIESGGRRFHVRLEETCPNDKGQC
jgi:methionyl-tRNA formyltransferase